MSTEVLLCVGLIGVGLYYNRYNLISSYYKYKNNGISSMLLTILFPNTSTTHNNYEVITYTKHGNVYYLTLPINHDKTATLGHRLELMSITENEVLTTDITPPSNVKLRLCPNDFGANCRINHYINGNIIIYFNDEVVSWPPEKEITIEE